MDELVCPHCGFPFSCDITPLDSKHLKTRRELWRYILGLTALIFWLTSAVVLQPGADAYYGHTNVLILTLAPEEASGISISPPESFTRRTQFALALLKSRAPDFYWRMQDGVAAIDFLGEEFLETEAGQRISLEGIGAVSMPAAREVLVLFSTAYPSGMDKLFDGDLFSYAGVLVHELRHIELYQMGQAPGGWKEEVLCERAALDALKQMGAPSGVMLRYELFLSNPQHRRYQPWYDWYDQF